MNSTILFAFMAAAGVFMVVMAVVLVLPGAILVNLAGGDHGVFPGWITENLTFLNGLVDGIISLF